MWTPKPSCSKWSTCCSSINFDDLRFAFLPSDLMQPAPFEEAVAAAAPTEGQSVLYHRADGSTARASVKTVNVPPPPPPPVATPHARQGLPIRHEESPAVKPTTFTIVVEDGTEVCTVRERLSRDVSARAQGQGATSSSSLLPYDNVTFPDPHSTVETSVDSLVPAIGYWVPVVQVQVDSQAHRGLGILQSNRISVCRESSVCAVHTLKARSLDLTRLDLT